MYDIYSYGIISPSRLLILKTAFPKSGHYSEIDSSYRMIGGEAANSSIVLSRLGLKVKLDGNWLKSDENGRYVKKILNDFKIDNSRIKLKKNFCGPEEFVFSFKTARTIFGRYINLLNGERNWNIPVKNDIRCAKIVCLDPFLLKESQLAANYASQYNIPYVTVDCKFTDKILKNAAVTIISDEFQKGCYKNMTPSKLFRKYQTNANGLVIFTSGSQNILYGYKNSPIQYYRPLKIKPVDTSGAGDSFRAGIIYGFLKKWCTHKTVQFASTLASLVCQRYPGVLDCPSLNEIQTHIKHQVKTVLSG